MFGEEALWIVAYDLEKKSVVIFSVLLKLSFLQLPVFSKRLAYHLGCCYQIMCGAHVYLSC